MRNLTRVIVGCFLVFPQPALSRKIPTPDAGIDVYLFTYC